MSLLYYWRGDNYRRDLDFGAGYHLNQANPLLHKIEISDSLWAFTRRRDGMYVLAAELIAKAKTLNPTIFRYGRYRLWGDLRLSRYFQVDGQPDITAMIRTLSPTARGDVLGRAFQGRSAVRKISDADHLVLVKYAQELPLEPRARLIPEERLEALLLSGNEESVNALLKSEPSGLAEERRRYLSRAAITRDRKIINHLREIYSGKCQICGWAPRSNYGGDLCEAHHVRWLSRGGMDDIENMVLICPNHHRAIHQFDAVFDWKDNAFAFSKHSESISVLNHQLGAS